MIKNFTSCLTALGLAATCSLTAYAGSFSDSFDYVDDSWPWTSFEDANGGNWVYNTPASNGNKLNMNAVGVNLNQYWGKAEYYAPSTSDFLDGSVSATVNFDSFEAPLGAHSSYVGVTARTQASGKSIQATITAQRIDPATSPGVNGEDTWYNLFFNVTGTDISTHWINTMSRANEVYTGKNLTIQLDLAGDDVSVSLIMDKSGDYGSTWEVETKTLTGKVTDADLLNAGAAGIHINQIGAPGSHHMYGAFTNFEAVIPEPASLALLAISGLAMLRRRQ
ncbi:hypothetical protein KS4_03480 [Poriferisphaera corsica]|uniref:Uncharacterized protein n=2 Tax=Poriferisphaera corsica TaxID=2528020 RepID=A0A517YQ17_9BACT|nr:hypothetical protein KS4_03480 [Poriferisphaera corsica]